MVLHGGMCIHVTSIINIKLYLDPFSLKDAADISKKLTKLSAEGAKVIYNEFSKEKSCPDKEWSNWRVFMMMILAWELQAKNSMPKREFFLKIKSIALSLTDKSDADKLQELVSSYMGQYMSLLHKGNEPKLL